jgi:CDP-diacylglycerol--serine O-phosphatidyltransferase
MNSTNFKLIYLLPNLFTASSIFLAIISIISSVKGEFITAGILIFGSMILDGLDGRVARMTNSTSEFGVEFDSLADVISFGVAPAMLLYFYCGIDYGKFGILCSALFVIFSAIRLARFNVYVGAVDSSVFVGIPTPASAMFITILILFFIDYNLEKDFGVILLIASLLASILMVSNIRYNSFKKISLDRKNNLKILILLLIVLSLLYLFPLEGVTIVITVYILSGVVRAAYNMFTRRIFIKKTTKEDK